VVGVADMNDPAYIRQAMDVTAATTKIALFFAVAFAALYLWRHTAFNLGFTCLWFLVAILGMFVHRARKRRLLELDPD
jgi:ABC-type bacteriocin/lantibiotic exporter with double-glycine peptidase domain